MSTPKAVTIRFQLALTHSEAEGLIDAVGYHEDGASDLWETLGEPERSAYKRMARKVRTAITKARQGGEP